MLGFLRRWRTNKTLWSGPSVEPWFDRPDALTVLDGRRARREVTDEQYELLRKWVTDGYVVLDGYVPEADIDGMNRFLDATPDAAAPIKGLTYLGVRDTPEAPTEAVSHAELLARYPTPARRREVLAWSNWRIHELHALNKNCQRLFSNKRVAEACSLIMGTRAIPRSSINFMYGSSQKVHQDLAVFHIRPRNYLIGAWLACEDIDPDSGPLEYYPGSHQAPWYPEFNNYPQTNLRTASDEHYDGYHAFLAEEAKKYERRVFLARKGQVFLWHALLFHGGSGINRVGRTRKSFVVHYITPGVDATHEVTGPVRWE